MGFGYVGIRLLFSKAEVDAIGCMTALSASPTLPWQKCCGEYEWQVWGSRLPRPNDGYGPTSTT